MDLLNPITDSPILDLSKNLYGKQISGFIYAAGVMPVLSVSESNRAEKHLFWQSQAESLRVNYLSCAEIIEDILPFIMSKMILVRKLLHLSHICPSRGC